MLCKFCFGSNNLIRFICHYCNNAYYVCARCREKGVSSNVPHCFSEQQTSNKKPRPLPAEPKPQSVFFNSSYNFELPTTETPMPVEKNPSSSQGFPFNPPSTDFLSGSPSANSVPVSLQNPFDTGETFQSEIPLESLFNDDEKLILFYEYNESPDTSEAHHPSEPKVVSFNQSSELVFHSLQTSNCNTPSLPPTSLAVCSNGIGGNHTQTFNTIGQVSLEIGVASWNINHLGDTEDPSNKTVKKLNTIERIFAQHAWLDVLVLQEVNESSTINLSGTGLTYIQGPRMKALSMTKKKPQSASAKSFKVKYFDDDVWAKPGQGEFYGIVVRNGAVTHEGCEIFYKGKLTAAEMDVKKPYYWSKMFGTNDTGDDEVQQETEDDGENPYEDDAEVISKTFSLEDLPTFRPIVVHKLRVNGKLVKVAVVHTSPKGKGFFRKSVYLQVKDFFTLVSEKTQANEYWIVGGDYYLEPEASTKIDSDSYKFTEGDETNLLSQKNKRERKAERLRKKTLMEEQFKDKINDFGLKIAISLSATNQGKVTYDAAQKIQRNPRLFYGFYARRRNGQQWEYVNNSRADFFVCGTNFVFTYAGILNPLGKTLLMVDTNHNALNWWADISDHAPVGGIFSITNQPKKWDLIRNELFNDAHHQLVETSIGKLRTTAFTEMFDSFEILFSYLSKFVPANQSEQSLLCKLRAAYCRLLNTASLIPAKEYPDGWTRWNLPNSHEWRELLKVINMKELDQFEANCLNFKNGRTMNPVEYTFWHIRIIANALRMLAHDFRSDNSFKRSDFEDLEETQTFSAVNAYSKQ